MYDLTDPLIVDMIKEKHTPEEIYHWSSTGGKRLSQIICGQCSEEWPCYPIIALRHRQENGTGQIL